MKEFIVEVRAFGKHIVVRERAVSREDAERQVKERFGIYITSQPAS